MVGFEPTTQQIHGPADDAIFHGISGVLVRLTTCKRLTNDLPKLRLTNTGLYMCCMLRTTYAPWLVLSNLIAGRDQNASDNLKRAHRAHELRFFLL